MDNATVARRVAVLAAYGAAIVIIIQMRTDFDFIARVDEPTFVPALGFMLLMLGALTGASYLSLILSNKRYAFLCEMAAVAGLASIIVGAATEWISRLMR